MEAEEWWEVPPPPPPPPSSSDCAHFCPAGGGPLGAHFNRASFPSMPLIAVVSSVVLVAVLVATFLLWRHKTKVQNLLPCKSEPPQGGQLGASNGITYEDVLINRHPGTRIPQGHQTLMPLEILDVKLGPNAPIYRPPDMAPPPHHHHLKPPPFHHPVYEEVEPPSSQQTLPTSEEEFEDGGGGSASSSVRGSTGGDLCRDPASSGDEDYPPHHRWTYPSQENIYSTIDEDEQQPPASLAAPKPPLSQEGSSYGDMMPAFHAATFM